MHIFQKLFKFLRNRIAEALEGGGFGGSDKEGGIDFGDPLQQASIDFSGLGDPLALAISDPIGAFTDEATAELAEEVDLAGLLGATEDFEKWKEGRSKIQDNLKNLVSELSNFKLTMDGGQWEDDFSDSLSSESSTYSEILDDESNMSREVIILRTQNYMFRKN